MLFLRDLECSDLARRNACWSVGLRYKIVWMLLFSFLYIILSRNNIFLGEIWNSNLMVLCFSFNSFMDVINSAFAPLHIICDQYVQVYLRLFFNVWIDLFCSNFAVKMFAQVWAHIVFMTQPIVCKYCVQFNAKLFRVKIKLRKDIITSVNTVFSWYFSWDSLTAFIPLLFGMFIYSDLTSSVTRRLSWGMSFTFSNLLRKSCVPLT